MLFFTKFFEKIKKIKKNKLKEKLNWVISQKKIVRDENLKLRKEYPFNDPWIQKNHSVVTKLNIDEINLRYEISKL